MGTDCNKAVFPFSGKGSAMKDNKDNCICPWFERVASNATTVALSEHNNEPINRMASGWTLYVEFDMKNIGILLWHFNDDDSVSQQST
jgi:hypothetical protein